MSNAFSLDMALATAREAAQAAGEVIRHYWRHGVAVEHKADATPVTVADREAEKAIREVIAGTFPGHAFYGEEFGRQGHAGSAYLWLVDPLDGTKSFVRRTPFLSTQIALMHEGRLVLGVSAAPIFGETMWACVGGGAHVDGEPVRVSDTAELSQASISTGNIATLTRDARWNALGRLIRDSNRIRGYGDFCHYHLLARGGLDVVIESDVNILDIAALTVIVREAGGVFSDLDGGEIGLDTTSVLAAVPALHGEVLERMVEARG